MHDLVQQAPVLSSIPSTPHGLTTCVPRQYVHKAAMAEVLLTGWERVAEDTFTIGAQWPRTHSFYTPVDGRYDPLLFAETVRQTIPLLSHLAYDTPFGHHLIWDHFRYELDPAATAVAATPAEIELRITCSDVKRRQGRFSALVMDVTALRDGAPLGTARARFTSHAPAVYRRLRGEYGDPSVVSRAVPLAPPLAPVRVGRDRFHDVVLSPTDADGVWQLRVDPSHPVLFDHPVDHAPGMLLLEAARQAALAATGPDHGAVLGLETVFSQYVEFDSPCWIEATVLPQDDGAFTRTRVTARQNDREAFSAVVTSTAGRSGV
ncbi:ScbA/BarX family gamma-butyrolactone biosynthesis protein [Streptomyces ehimensis]|uniref:ScbA/BarX family gamma-butyrolactone biosynthesis protein n=1 Tax=Streptomyces ehimensis TaxID=68195 RepID=A0ABV9BD06_9ACTN